MFLTTAALKQTLQTQTGDIKSYKEKVQRLQNELIKVSLYFHIVADCCCSQGQQVQYKTQPEDDL